jgi:hypothetical protein
MVAAVLLTKDLTDLPNQVSQAALAVGFVRLIRRFAVRLPLELKLVANEGVAAVVPHRSSAGGGGFYSWACFSLAPIPALFRSFVSASELLPAFRLVVGDMGLALGLLVRCLLLTILNRLHLLADVKLFAK